MDTLRESILQEIGLARWTARESMRAQWLLGSPIHDETALAIDPAWQTLASEIAACRRCPRGAQRRQAFCGSGDTHAAVLILGDVPDAEEDQVGAPWVGATGQLLDNMLAAIQLHRHRAVYLTAAVKCHCPNRLDIAEFDVALAACRPYLLRQIALLQPRLILALGAHAARALLPTDTDATLVAGQWREWQGIPLLTTHHPRDLLLQPMDKRQSWHDLCQVRQRLAAT